MSSVDALHGSVGSVHRVPAANGPERLTALRATSEASVMADPTIDKILALLQRLLKVHYSVVSVVRSGAVALKQARGLEDVRLLEAPGFCSLVPKASQILIFEDTLEDTRTASNPLVVQPPHMRFYAAAPLVASDRQGIGTLCVVHTEPRAFSTEHAAVLCNFAELVVRVLEGQLLQHDPASAALEGASKRGADAYHQAGAVLDTSAPGWEVLHANEAFSALAGGSMQDGKFWDGFQAPPNSGLEAREPRAGQCMPVRSRSKAGFRGVLQATLRPLNTHKLVTAALLGGNPGRREAAGAGRAQFGRLHVALLAAKPVARQRRTLPFADLRLGTALGAGTYAKVYRGTHAGERVAVKVVHDGERCLGVDGRPLEAAINSAMVHPNVVRLLDHRLEGGTGRQRLFMLLEYCDLGTLGDAVDQGWFRMARTLASPPCLRVILTTATQIARGFSHLHARGVVHGDVSGGNILLQSSGAAGSGEFTAKISDFGLSHWQADGGLASSEVTGTPSYLSPEVLRGGPHTQASDVFSLGVLLYEMLAGKRAWAGMATYQIMHAVLFLGESLPPLPPGLPPGVDAIVLRCLDPNHLLRCTSAELIVLLDVESALLADPRPLGEAPLSHTSSPVARLLLGDAAKEPLPPRARPNPKP